MNYRKHDSKKEVKVDHSNSNTDSRQKGKHFPYGDRRVINSLHERKFSNRAIARELNCLLDTSWNEALKLLLIATECGISPRLDQDHNRKHCRRKIESFKYRYFMDYVVKHFYQDSWSLDACVGRALAVASFFKDEAVSTKTLYKYVDQRLLNIINLDLPMKVTHSKKTYITPKPA